MNNTLTIADIKRRGMAAIEESLRQGPVHIVERNKLAAVVLSVEEYQRLSNSDVKDPGGMTAVQWLSHQAGAGKRNKVQIDADLNAERAW